MKCTHLLAIAALGCGLGSAAMGQDAAKSEGRKVVASATATAFVAPDSARVTFAITTTEGTQRSAQEANAQQVKRVKEAIAALPLDHATVEMHVLPASFSVIVTSQQNPTAVRVPQSKKAQSVFQVVVRDKNLEKLQAAVRKIAETAADQGGTAIEPENPLRTTLRLPARLGGAAEETETVAGPGIEWVSLGNREARRDAIKRALADALADAQAVAGSENLKVIEVNVTGSDESPLLRSRVLSGTGAAETALIPIRVQVRVTCGY